MDTITHALLGTLAARATAPKTPTAGDIPLKTRLIVGGIAAAFPDIDFFTRWLDPLAFISDWHRGITHSIAMLPVWAVVLGFLFALVVRRQRQWRDFVLICAISIGTHIATDVITSWHTVIFAPFSDYRPSLNWTFIIDPIFTAIILGGLLVAWWQQSQRLGQFGVLVLAAYIGLQAFWHQQATQVARDYTQSKGWQGSKVSVMPQPFSPLNWKLVINHGDHYQVSYLKLYTNHVAPISKAKAATLWDINNYYRPRTALRWQRYTRIGNTPLVKQVWQHPLLERYRRFASYPMLYRIDQVGAEQCVWFGDLRFALPRRTLPFRYGLCRQNRQSEWQRFRLLRGSENLRVAV